MSTKPIDTNALTDEQLDLALAEKLFGWSSPRLAMSNMWKMTGYVSTGRDSVYGQCMDRPTQTWDGMRFVIEAMRERGWWGTLQCPHGFDPWQMAFLPLSMRHRYCAWHYADSAPLAVAGAALKALNAEEKYSLIRETSAKCTDCNSGLGEQHKPHCHRQGIVTGTSHYLRAHESGLDEVSLRVAEERSNCGAIQEQIPVLRETGQEMRDALAALARLPQLERFDRDRLLELVGKWDEIAQ